MPRTATSGLCGGVAASWLRDTAALELAIETRNRNIDPPLQQQLERALLRAFLLDRPHAATPTMCHYDCRDNLIQIPYLLGWSTDATIARDAAAPALGAAVATRCRLCPTRSPVRFTIPPRASRWRPSPARHFATTCVRHHIAGWWRQSAATMADATCRRCPYSKYCFLCFELCQSSRRAAQLSLFTPCVMLAVLARKRAAHRI
jgi:hypothetical protein